jgi:hypothetical protein
MKLYTIKEREMVLKSEYKRILDIIVSNTLWFLCGRRDT